MVEYLSDLRLFVHIVRMESISKAGKSLNLSPALASKRLQRLEGALQTTLIHRTTRKIALTQAGKDVYQKSLAIVEHIQTLSASPETTNLTGHLRVGAPVSFGYKYVAPCIADFMALYPNLYIDLLLEDTPSDRIGDGIDVMISIAPLRPSNLAVHTIASNKKILVANPTYIKNHGMPARPCDLVHHQCLTLGNHKHWKLTHTKNAKETKVIIKSRFNGNNGLATVALAKLGLGICIKSWWDVVDDLAEGHLVHILPDYVLFQDVDIRLSYARSKELPLKITVFRDFLTQALAKKLPS